jgi:hypothetical protein
LFNQFLLHFNCIPLSISLPTSTNDSIGFSFEDLEELKEKRKSRAQWSYENYIKIFDKLVLLLCKWKNLEAIN